MNNLTKYTPHPLTSVIFIVAFAFLYFNASPLLYDPDVPWHLAAGQYILDHKTIPFSDLWSFTMEEQQEYTWYNIAWGWDVVIALIANLFGEGGLFVITVAFAAFIVSLMAHHLLQRGYHDDVVKIMATLVGLVIWHSLFARPHLMSYLLAFVFYIILHNNKEKHHKHPLLITLPLLMVLWVNMHGGFLAGFTVIGAFFIEAVVKKQHSYAKQLLCSGVLCGLALCVNPYGIYIVDAVLRSLNSSITNYIGEWRSFAYGDFLGPSVYLLVFIFASNSRDKNIPLSDKILAFAWLIAALFSIRNFAIFSLLSAPYLAYNIQQSIELKKHKEYNTPARQVGIFAIACAVIVIFLVPSTRQELTFHEIIVDEERAPLAAINYIREHYPDKRFLNHYDIGGYMIYFAPEYKVFADGRAGTAYSEEALQDILQFFFFEDGWQDLLSKYHIDGIIIPNQYKNNLTTLEKDKRWKLVFESKAANVYIKR